MKRKGKGKGKGKESILSMRVKRARPVTCCVDIPVGDCCSETQDFGQSEKTSQRNRAERFVFLFGSVVFGKLTVVYIRFLKKFGS